MRFFLAVFLLSVLSMPAFADMQAWVAEARTFEGNCKADSLMSMRTNCRCLANKIFVARQTGSTEQQSVLVGHFVNECVNAPAIAGTAYARCVPMAQAMELEVESFCKCYANNFANQRNVASAGFHETQQMMTNAMRICGLGTDRAKARSPQGQTLDDIRRLRGGAVSPRLE